MNMATYTINLTDKERDMLIELLWKEQDKADQNGETFNLQRVLDKVNTAKRS